MPLLCTAALALACLELTGRTGPVRAPAASLRHGADCSTATSNGIVLIPGVARARAGAAAPTAPPPALLRGRRAAPSDRPASITRDRDGAVVRGPRHVRQIALVFTGHEYAEGLPVILDELRRVRGRAAFFFTGDFLRQPALTPLVQRAIADGHYVGPHSDQHLLYVGWSPDKPTLVARDAFEHDLRDNLRALEVFGIATASLRYWIPAYEWYNGDIVGWASALGLVTLDFTRGTRSNADYMPDADPKFVSSAAIVDSILAHERRDPDGLNGFVLLMHVGAGPGRREPLHARLGALLDELGRRGYRFVGVDDLLRPR